jgi:hypothetical protein
MAWQSTGRSASPAAEMVIETVLIIEAPDARISILATAYRETEYVEAD